MNYFVRAMWVILISFFMIKLFSKTKYKRIKSLIHSDSNQIKKLGLGMLISLILLHIIFH